MDDDDGEHEPRSASPASAESGTLHPSSSGVSNSDAKTAGVKTLRWSPAMKGGEGGDEVAATRTCVPIHLGKLSCSAEAEAGDVGGAVEVGYVGVWFLPRRAEISLVSGRDSIFGSIFGLV